MAGSVQLARLFGIRIGASYSWFFFLFVMIWLLSDYFRGVVGGSDGKAFGVAVGAVLLYSASIVLHELGHALQAKRDGLTVEGIELWFFGGLARMSPEPPTPGADFRVSAAGPAATALVTLVAGIAAALLSDTSDFVDVVLFRDVQTSVTGALLGWLASINGILLVFNLLPALPLDGGHIARAIAWRATGDKLRATVSAARLGQGFSYLMIGVGVFLAFGGGDPINGVYLAVLGWFFGQSATAAIRRAGWQERLDGVTAADLMSTDPVTMPASTTVAEAEDAFFLRYGWSWFPVTDEREGFVGIVFQPRVQEELERGRPMLPVAEVVEPGGWAVPAPTTLEALLGSEPLNALGALAVLDDEGRLRGVVTVEQVRRALAAAVPEAA